MSDVRHCPTCGKTVILTERSISAGCGRCDLVLSAAEARESWPEERPEWMQPEGNE